MQLALAHIAQALDRALRLAPGVSAIDGARRQRRYDRFAERVARLARALRAYAR